jgi:hypothetical protein
MEWTAHTCKIQSHITVTYACVAQRLTFHNIQVGSGGLGVTVCGMLVPARCEAYKAKGEIETEELRHYNTLIIG